MEIDNDRHKSEGRHRPKLKRSKYDDGRRRKLEDDITTKTGGAYIPPAKLRMMRDNITDKTRY